ncbi:MAG: flagellar hook assembly protein FlgD [Acidihalobacter sp.]|uniref:flagellar hook assembly protein FlgD n=1 Tax=Acidihalobacter sp. TaxID=1872108 RepID=UPI00307D59B3
MTVATSNTSAYSTYQQLGLAPSTSSTSSGVSGTGALGEDAFLKLMVTEIQNQDPTKPVDSQSFLAQLAQFSSVTGIQNLQKTVTNLAGSLTTSQSLQAASLVGHNVLVPAKQAELPASGGLSGAVDVSTAAQRVVVGVYSASGQLVKQIDLGAQSAGLAGFTWDGTDSNGTPMPAGTYAIRAEAAVDGKAEAMDTLASTRVNSVTLGSNGGSITLGLADGLGNVDLSKVRQIS